MYFESMNTIRSLVFIDEFRKNSFGPIIARLVKKIDKIVLFLANKGYSQLVMSKVPPRKTPTIHIPLER